MGGMADMTPLMLSTPSTFTVTVFTRHSRDCSYKDNPQWKRCKCRKSVYIYEGGKRLRMSARTRSWGEAERLAQSERDKRDPVKMELKRIADEEAKKATEQQAKQIAVADSLDRWIAGLKIPDGPTRDSYDSFRRKFIGWTERVGVLWLHEVTANLLDEWRGKWDPDAVEPENRMASNTQSFLLTRIRSFFRWAHAIKLRDDNPTLALAPIDRKQDETLPLTPNQFDELIAATNKYDAEKRREYDRFGVDMRAIFLLMRWTGLRIVDALLLKRSAIAGGRINITTQKTGAKIDRILPTVVLDALKAVPVRPNIHRDQYFWTRVCDHRTLSTMWVARIKVFADAYLDFKDDEGNAIRFHSHMLRDTFAVELLQAGMALEKVSRLLTHASVKTTEKHYAPWVKARELQLEEELVIALRGMGAEFGSGTKRRTAPKQQLTMAQGCAS